MRLRFCIGCNSRPVMQAIKLHKKLTEGGRLEKYGGGEFLYAFLCSLLREAEYPPSGKSSLVRRAMDIMEAEYAVLEGVEAVADRLGVSQEHLARCFRAQQRHAAGALSDKSPAPVGPQ